MNGDVCDLLCLDLPRAEALRRARPPSAELAAAAEGARALGDPTRLAVAVALRDGGERLLDATMDTAVTARG